jgi:hypothetical protein
MNSPAIRSGPRIFRYGQCTTDASGWTVRCRVGGPPQWGRLQHMRSHGHHAAAGADVFSEWDSAWLRQVSAAADSVPSAQAMGFESPRGVGSRSRGSLLMTRQRVAMTPCTRHEDSFIFVIEDAMSHVQYVCMYDQTATNRQTVPLPKASTAGYSATPESAAVGTVRAGIGRPVTSVPADVATKRSPILACGASTNPPTTAAACPQRGPLPTPQPRQQAPAGPHSLS